MGLYRNHTGVVQRAELCVVYVAPVKFTKRWTAGFRVGVSDGETEVRKYRDSGEVWTESGVWEGHG